MTIDITATMQNVALWDRKEGKCADISIPQCTPLPPFLFHDATFCSLAIWSVTSNYKISQTFFHEIIAHFKQPCNY